MQHDESKIASEEKATADFLGIRILSPLEEESIAGGAEMPMETVDHHDHDIDVGGSHHDHVHS